MTADELVIERLASDEDLDEVAALEAASFTNPWTRDMLAKELSQSDVARVYVLRLPGQRVAAFCACWILFDELHINTIAVDPVRRRQGLASALMRFVLADAARAGARRATLEVRRSNEAARELYARLGFTESGIRHGYYTSPDEDALILWREGLDAPEPDDRRS
jgi:[ribosomal protein S18]-alanine N-acetyltransferase